MNIELASMGKLVLVRRAISIPTTSSSSSIGTKRKEAIADEHRIGKHGQASAGQTCYKHPHDQQQQQQQHWQQGEGSNCRRT